MDRHLRFQDWGEQLIVPIADDPGMVDVTIRISHDAMRFLTRGTGVIGNSGALVERLIREHQDRLMSTPGPCGAIHAT